MSRLELRFPGLTIYGAPNQSPALPGFYLARKGFEGWDDGVSGRRERIDITGGHGEYDLPVLRGARLVTLKGHALARSPFELGQLRSQIMGLGADGDKVRMHVEHHGRVLWADVRRLDATFEDVGSDGTRTRAEWALDLLAADPRKYGTETRSFTGGTVLAHHFGNFPAKIQAVVRGPRAAGYEITGPGGRKVVVSQALETLDHHTIQFWSGRVYRNGTRQLGALTVFQPWTVPPGPPTAMSCSSGPMTINITDTYI